jgi:hypothetical protein
MKRFSFFPKWRNWVQIVLSQTSPPKSEFNPRLGLGT